MDALTGNTLGPADGKKCFCSLHEVEDDGRFNNTCFFSMMRESVVFVAVMWCNGCICQCVFHIRTPKTCCITMTTIARMDMLLIYVCI